MHLAVDRCNKVRATYGVVLCSSSTSFPSFSRFHVDSPFLTLRTLHALVLLWEAYVSPIVWFGLLPCISLILSTFPGFHFSLP